MNILLFERGGIDFFVASERKHEPAADTVEEQGRIARIREKVRSTYDALRHKFDYQENLCSGLRHAETLSLLHPTDLGRAEAERRFRDFLDFRQQKHRRWMIIDGILALFGSLLTPIPGPNVFFLYPAVRSLSHYLAFRGARQADGLKMMNVGAEALIDQIQANLKDLDKVEIEVQELEDRFDLRNLKGLLSSR